MPAIKKRNEIWFDYPADPFNFELGGDYEKDEMGGALCISYLSDAEKEDLRRKYSPIKTTFKGESGSEVSAEFDTKKEREETAAAYIKDWKGFFAEDKTTVLHCTDKNKRLFSAEDGFMAVLRKCIEKVESVVAEQKKADSKN